MRSQTLKQALSLYLVTDCRPQQSPHIETIVLAAIAGGVSCVQLREKKLDTRTFVERARRLKALLAPHSIPLVINDRIDVALACEADGVHLGQSDLSPIDARRLLPLSVFIGWSVESEEQLKQAEQFPIDYLGLSPVFTTTTKTDIQTPWGLDGVKMARQSSRLPLVAIGGINIANGASVLNAGADGLAVVSAISEASDPRAAAHALRQLINKSFERGFHER